MLFLFAVAIGVLYGVIKLIGAIANSYQNNKYTTGKTVAIVFVNAVIMGICFIGGVAIEADFGFMFISWLAWAMIANCIMLFAFRPREEPKRPTPTKHDDYGTIDWR